MKKILFFVVLVLFSLPVYSAEWQLDSTGSFEIDKNSISKTKNSVKAWVMSEEKGRFIWKKYILEKSYLEANCQDRTISFLYMALYNKKGKLVTSYDFEEKDEVLSKRVIPDSRGEIIYNELCSYLKKK